MKTVFAIVALFMSLCFCTATAQTQPNDSIDIGHAVAMTIQNHPSVRQAEYGVTASGESIGASRSAHYPDVSIDGEYARIGPVPSFELPGQGPLELAPRNNYNFYLGVRQTLYDFGRTSESVRLAKTSLQAATDNVDMVKFGLAYQTTSVFNGILILHRRIDVLGEQLQTLRQHLDMSVKKLNAGTATDFDTLTIQVKLAVVTSDSIDAARALESQEIFFRQLTGLPWNAPVNLRGDFASTAIELNPDSLISAAESQRPELVLSRDAESSAKVRTRLASLGDKPTLALSLTSGLKNGYEPNLNTWRGNYVAGLQLKIPLFNGYRSKHLESEAHARFNSAQAHTNDIEQLIRSEVLQAIAGVNSSLEKIASTDAQVEQAEQAVSMARVRYAAGVITNLELLDTETTLSQAKLIRLRAFYDYTVSLDALDRATGKKLW